jgi:hypothetical protein
MKKHTLKASNLRATDRHKVVKHNQDLDNFYEDPAMYQEANSIVAQHFEFEKESPIKKRALPNKPGISQISNANSKSMYSQNSSTYEESKTSLNSQYY